MAQGEWLRLTEAAHRMGISVHTLRRRIKANEVQHRTEKTRHGEAYTVYLEVDAPPEIEDAPAPRSESSELLELVREQGQQIAELSAQVGYWRGRYEELSQPLQLEAPEASAPAPQPRPWWQRWLRRSAP
jgi:hypothetical protein